MRLLLLAALALGLALGLGAAAAGGGSEPDAVTCGSVVKLLNVRHNVRLHSHDVRYGSGTGRGGGHWGSGPGGAAPSPVWAAAALGAFGRGENAPLSPPIHLVAGGEQIAPRPHVATGKAQPGAEQGHRC